MVGDLEKSSFSNIEQQSLEFVKYTLDPWVIRWEQSLQRTLLSSEDKKEYFFKFNLEDAIIASNANIGGPTTAAGMAISQGWVKLVGPAMLVGVLGYVVGNYAGTIVGIVLGA